MQLSELVPPKEKEQGTKREIHGFQNKFKTGAHHFLAPFNTLIA